MGAKKTGIWKTYFALHVILFVYAAGSIFSKLASREEFLSWKFLLLYGLMIGNLFLYALNWQQILKRLPLTVAFANKSIIIVWGMVWGAWIFGEIITIKMIIGAVVIIMGISMVVTDNG